MSARGDARRRTGGNAGEGGISYLAVISLIGIILAGIVVTPLGATVSAGITSAVCEVVKAGRLTTCEAVLPTAGGNPAPTPQPTETPTDEDAKFQPERCIIATETDKSKTATRVLFFKITTSEEVKLTQWSDGTITVDYVGSVGGGVEGGLDIPGLKAWNGTASLTGSFVQGSGGGGRWMFDKNKTGDPQEDLRLNHKDAEDFIKYLQGQNTCKKIASSTPYGLDSGVFCNYYNEENYLPELPPDKVPDLDITKTTREGAGDFKFGGSVSKNGKTVVSGQGKGLQGTVTDDVMVMRGGGEITFVYTMEIGGKMGTGYQGEGGILQQVYVTYNAEDYDREEKENKPHHPTKLRFTKAERGVDGNPGTDLKGTVPAGPINIQVEGAGGKTDTLVHTEVAELAIDNAEDATTIEDWLNDRSDNPATGLPFPSTFAAALPPNSDAFTRLMHDKGKLSSMDYNVNIDWWKAGMAISLGVSLGKWSSGFKLFGMEISNESEDQTLTGLPLYAGAPRTDGIRPWFPFTNCTRVTPIS